MAYDKDALPVDDFTGEGVVEVDKSAKIDTSQAADSALTPADQVKPQDIGIAADEGVQQIPATITVTQESAVTEARDALLAAIGVEAQAVADKSAGQASTALAALARTYALVATDIAAIAVPAVHARAGEATLSISLVAHVPTNGFYVVPTDADLVNKVQDMSFSPIPGTMKPIDGFFDVRSQSLTTRDTVLTQPPAVTDARDTLLAAIGAEAQLVAEKSAGQASGALTELAYAYAYARMTFPPSPTGRRRGMIEGMEDTVSGK
ncbi:hypothetical protein ACWGNM_31610 [Streptomyces sp. NPDC055796]